MSCPRVPGYKILLSHQNFFLMDNLLWLEECVKALSWIDTSASIFTQVCTSVKKWVIYTMYIRSVEIRMVVHSYLGQEDKYYSEGQKSNLGFKPTCMSLFTLSWQDKLLPFYICTHVKHYDKREKKSTICFIIIIF